MNRVIDRIGSRRFLLHAKIGRWRYVHRPCPQKKRITLSEVDFSFLRKTFIRDFCC